MDIRYKLLKIISIFIIHIFLKENCAARSMPNSTDDNGVKRRYCDVTEIFCEEYNACLSKQFSKDTCESIINRLKISCPEKTKFCYDKLICLPENQDCLKKANEKLSKIETKSDDCRGRKDTQCNGDSTTEEYEYVEKGEEENVNIRILRGHNSAENESKETTIMDTNLSGKPVLVKSVLEIEPNPLTSSKADSTIAPPALTTEASATTHFYSSQATTVEKTTTFYQTTTTTTTPATSYRLTTTTNVQQITSTINIQQNFSTILTSLSTLASSTAPTTTTATITTEITTTTAVDSTTASVRNGLSTTQALTSTSVQTTVPKQATSALPKANPDYVLLHYTTAGTEDIRDLLAPNLPQSTASIKVLNVLNVDAVGIWVIRANDYEYKFTGANKDNYPNISLTNSTEIYLQNSKTAGIAQLVLETWSQWRTGSSVMAKIVYPKSSVHEMNLTLKTSEMTVNIDENPKWINIADLVDLDFSDNFRNLRQDAEELFDKLSNAEDRQLKQKSFRLQMSQLESALGLCLSPVTNPLIVGTVEAENLNNHTKTSISLWDGDKLCVLKKQYQITFRFSNGSSGTQMIYIIPWNGDYHVETPSDNERLLTINVFSQKFKDATIPAQTNLNLSTLITPTVSYNLTDTLAANKSVFGVDTLVSQFFTVSVGKNVSLGMAVVSAGEGSYGQWQYLVKNIWTNFPTSLHHGMDIFKTDVRTRSNQKYSNFNFTEFKDTSFIEALLLDGNVKVRFMPSGEKSFWSSADAVKDTALAFLAWNIPKGFNYSDNGSFIQLDVPLCSKCSTLQIGKQGVILYAERYGCDNVLSSMKIMDDCNVCGGTNQCYDCKNVPYGKSKWVCGVCTENGDSFKDCRGVCNGSAQIFPDGRCIDPNNDVKGCDGDYISLAYINECNFCVGGLTNRSVGYGKDRCGVCNGSNLCLGCDGVPNSGKVLDLCKRCLNPSDVNFNKGCGVKFGSISNYILNNTNQTVTLEVSGISETSEVSCVLDPADENRKNFTLITSKPQKKTANKEDYVFAIYYAYGVPGQYTLICTIDGSTVQFNQTVHIFDYSVFQINAAYPVAINLDDSAADRKVKLTGKFPPDLSKDPFCLDGVEFSSFNVYAALSYSATEVVCDLSRVQKSTLLSLRIIPRNDMLIYMVEKQTPIGVKVLAKTPSLIRANFGVSLADLTVYFDVNIQGPQMCDKIFQESVYAKLGDYPFCSFSANELRVVLGQKSGINVGDKITVKPNVISQANVEFPSYFRGEYDIRLAEPVQKSVPQIQLAQTNKATQCATSVIVAVTKTQGDGGRPMTYKWSLQSVQSSDLKTIKSLENKLSSFLKTQNGSQIEIPIIKSDYTVDIDLELTGCNFLNYCSRPTTTRVTVDALEETLNIFVFGLEPPIRSSEKLKLSASSSLVYCNNEKPLDDNVKYYWEIVQNDSQATVLPKYGKYFVIPKMTFLPGHSVQVVVQAVYMNDRLQKNITAIQSTPIKFEGEPLWVRIEPKTRKHGANQRLVLDASLSVDPNRKDDTLLQHTWTCLKLDRDANVSRQVGTPCYVNSNGTAVLLEQVLETDQPKLIVPAMTLFPGMYNFTDTVRSGSLVQDKTVTVTLSTDNVIATEQTPLAERKPNVGNSLHLHWTVPAIPNATVQINFVQSEGYGKCTIPKNMQFKTNQTIPTSVPLNSTYIVSVTLPAKGSQYYSDWQGLDEGTSYKIKLTVNSSDRYGESEYEFRTNKPPSLGVFELIPNNSLIKAIDTLVTLNAASGWTDNEEDLPLIYSFGIKYHLADKTTKDIWFPPSSSDKIVVQFPSALNSHPICNRIGYQAMVKVCDYYGACATKIVPEGPFQVQVPDNLTASVETILKDVEKASASGQLFLAYQKIQLLLAELCDNISPNIQNSVSNVALDIMSNLDENLEKEEILSYLEQTIALVVRPSVLANDNLYNRFLSLTKKVGNNFGLISRQIKSLLLRKKRSVDIGPTDKNIDSNSASQLLSAYELILKHSADLPTISMYLGAAEDMSTQLCVGRDPTMEPAFVQATGVQNPVGTIKVSSLVTNPASDSQQITSSIALDKNPITVEFSKQFLTKYQAWSCNRQTTVCNDMCIITAQYDTGWKFSPLSAYFYANLAAVSSSWTWNLLSKVYYVDLADPFTGDPFLFDKNDSYSVWVPANLSSTDLYQCKIFGNNSWLDTVCSTNQTKLNGSQIYVYCSCNRLGYVSVFEAPLPPLQGISARQPTNVSFTVTNGTFNGATLQTLANTINVSPLRFVDFHITFVTVGIHTVWLVLKPPQAFDSEDSSFVVYKLNQTLKDQSKLSTFYAVPNSLTVSPTKIVSNLDADPRNVTITFINSYDALKNKTFANALITLLTNQISDALDIKPYRILYSSIVSNADLKTVFNFVIQTPTSSKEISAESATNRLRDMFYYGGRVFNDSSGAPMTIDVEGLNVARIDKLPAPEEPYDPMPTIVGSVIGSIFFVVIVIVIILVIVKQKNRVEKISPDNSPPHSGNLTNSNRSSAQTTLLARRVSVAEDPRAVPTSRRYR